MKVALVHESLAVRGGAERVIEELARTFPEAPVYTLEKEHHGLLADRDVRVSFLRHLPTTFRRHRWLLPLSPIAAETFDLSFSDVVISSSSAFAKGIVTRPNTLHICYCHAASRFLWDAYPEILAEHRGSVRRGLLQITLHALRLWDRAASRRVDFFVANSETTRGRIRKYYGRNSTVIYPPVNVEYATKRSSPRRYFLFVGRLSPYKRASLVIHAFNKLELPLVVAGEGRDLRNLQHIAGRTITFRGFVPDAELPDLYGGARAVIFPSDDDFGIVPVEAMAHGTPVIALRRGGATETVVEGITGEFFDEPLEELLADCVRRFLEAEGTYDAAMRARSARFSPAAFQTNIRAFVEQAWEAWQRA